MVRMTIHAGFDTTVDEKICQVLGTLNRGSYAKSTLERQHKKAKIPETLA